MRKPLLTTAVFALSLSAAATMAAQSSYGTVGGSVTDSTGAAVPGASVTLKSIDTGETRVVKTNSAGGFFVESVGTGHYNITAEAPSFARTEVANILVQPSVTTSVNAVLQVGSANDVVEVSGSKEILQTESGEVSANITGSEIAKLPISSLNPTNLAVTLPGVTTVTTGSSGNGPQFSVNGSRPRANNYLIEGQDNNDAGLTGQGLQPQNTESFDSASFLLNGYNAEFGYAGGGVSNIVFKSGTNRWHGSAYDRLLNSSLNAINHQQHYLGTNTKTKFRENIYGGTIGFPILHDKLFMFAAYQQDHYRSSSILSTLVVPTTAGYATLNQFAATNARIKNLVTAYGGLTGAVPSAANNNAFAAYYKNVALGLDPVTKVDRGNVEYGGVQRTIARNTNASELDLKADYLATPADKVQFRFIRSYSLIPYDVGNFPSQLPLFDTNQGGPAENAGIVYTHIFSPHLLNEFRASYGRISFVFDLRPDTYSNPLALGPNVSIAGVQGYGIPTNVPQGRSHNTYQLQDALSWTKGGHTVKVGFDVAQIRVRDAVPFVFYGAISYVASAASGTTPAYTALGNYMDDFSGFASSTGQSVSQQFGNNIARPYLTTQNYYVQDHFKATPRLALDYGVRYEYIGAPFNYLSNPATDFAHPFDSFANPVKQNPTFTNVAPRLGFAYQLTNDNKTVIRGAFGVFYDHLFTNIVDNLQATAPNAASPVIYGNTASSPRGTGNWSGQFANLSHTPLPTNSQTTISNNIKSPLTYQFNLALQRQLPAGFGLTVGYAGSRGLHLYALDALNPTYGGANAVRVNTSRASIAAFDNAGDSVYHGLQLELEHKYRSSLLARVAYTFSRGLDDVSDPYTSGNQSAYPEIQPTLPTGGAARGRDWGLSAYDHRQRAVATFIYNTPNFKWDGAKGILARIINNYSVSAIPSYQSGSVYNVQTGIDINNDSITNDRPVLSNKNAPINTFSVRSLDFYATSPLAGPNTYCDGSYIYNATTKNPVTGANDVGCHVVDPNNMHWFIGNRYQQNATIGRNSGVTPGVFNIDAAAERTFRIREQMGLVFRAEAFNVLNHANTGIPSFTLYGSTLQPNAAGYANSTFGNYASTITGARNLRFFLKYQF